MTTQSNTQAASSYPTCHHFAKRHHLQAGLLIAAVLTGSLLSTGCSTTPTVKPTATVMTGIHGRL